MQKDMNFRSLIVVGYADQSEADPAGLSFRRALAIREELIRLGIAPELLLVQGNGVRDIKGGLPVEMRGPWRNRCVEFGVED
jgi:outer membrane protein OmpA-like peptidoglycan-associated protein